MIVGIDFQLIKQNKTVKKDFGERLTYFAVGCVGLVCCPAVQLNNLVYIQIDNVLNCHVYCNGGAIFIMLDYCKEEVVCIPMLYE